MTTEIVYVIDDNISAMCSESELKRHRGRNRTQDLLDVVVEGMKNNSGKIKLLS